MKIQSSFGRKVVCNLPGFRPTWWGLGKGVKFSGGDAAAGMVAMAIVGFVDQAVSHGVRMGLVAADLAVEDDKGAMHLRGSRVFRELHEHSGKRRLDEEALPGQRRTATG